MADDLDSFFKKKTNKKKKATVKIEKLGKKLEKTAKRQEEIDREEEEQRQREKDNEDFIQSRLQEDNEWIDFNTQEVNVDGLKIKDMEIGEPEALDEDGEAQEVLPEKTKSWALPDSKENEKPTENGVADAAPAPAAAAAAQKTTYVPPSMRYQSAGRSAAPVHVKLEDTAQFPSLGDADTIAEQQRAREKAEQQRKLEEQARQQRQTAAAAPKSEQIVDDVDLHTTDNAYVPPWQRSGATTSTPPVATGPSRYEPPQQRATARGTDRDADGFQHQSQRRMGYGGSSFQERSNAPAPMNNRFEVLRNP